ncbi:phospho-sugar mutase [Allofustis seminis]|uniref:phospho-sugar mutase n=1 Tax=Allofustis seminis TaxID=166939 RepID=UPI00037FD309|nr:phospho-sugar mutase [Allofustis seminis]
MTLWQTNYEKWHSKAKGEIKQALEALSDSEKKDAFETELSFGTAGLRGIIGLGTNRMNKYIVRQTTRGLAEWISAQGEEEKERGVVISYDNRHFSQDFAFEAAKVLGKCGIRSYVFEHLTPTPVLAFSVRHWNAVAGIMITASHNPPAYNGYKVYGEDGGQFPPDAADRLASYIDKIDSPFDVEVADKETLIEQGVLKLLGEETIQAYLKEVEKVTVNRDVLKEASDKIQFVYSGMHGTGTRLVKRVFEQLESPKVAYVTEQCVEDPDFSTVESPNPETEPAFDLSKKLAEEVNADVLFATDPDSDRLGVCVRMGKGKYHLLSGNQTASLMLDYLVNHCPLPNNPALIRSIVSSHLPDKIVKPHGVDVFEVLTGFKFVGNQIKEFEATHSHEMILGYEEAIGYLIKPFVRDKDGFQALTLMTEVASYHFLQGRNLMEALELIYKTHGYFSENTISVQYPGLEGKEKMAAIMDRVRKTDLDEIAGYPVKRREDFLTLQSVEDGVVTPLNYTSSNVLRYLFADESFIALRPSGTEPKIKLYMSAVGETRAKADEKLKAFEHVMLQMIK